MLKTIKVHIHSVVDLITNSSTTVFIYRDSVEEVKELVQEMLNLCDIKDKTPDDIFYYGVFPNFDNYFSLIDDGDVEPPEGMPVIDAEYRTPEREKQKEARNEWIEALKLSVMRGEIKEPDWFEAASLNYDDFPIDTYLHLVPRDEKYTKFAEKVEALLGSITGDGYRDG